MSTVNAGLARHILTVAHIGTAFPHFGATKC